MQQLYINTANGQISDSIGSPSGLRGLTLKMGDLIDIELVAWDVNRKGIALAEGYDWYVLIMDRPGGTVLAAQYISGADHTADPARGVIYRARLNLHTEPIAALTGDMATCQLEVAQVLGGDVKKTSQLVAINLVRGLYQPGLYPPEAVAPEWEEILVSIEEALKLSDQLNEVAADVHRDAAAAATSAGQAAVDAVVSGINRDEANRAMLDAYADATAANNSAVDANAAAEAAAESEKNSTQKAQETADNAAQVAQALANLEIDLIYVGEELEAAITYIDGQVTATANSAAAAKSSAESAANILANAATKTGSQNFSGVNTFDIAPSSDKGVVRKIDLDIPVDVPYRSRTANLGYQLHWVSGAFASAFGGVYATTTTPALFLDTLPQPNVNSQVWRYFKITGVLSKIAYKTAAVKNNYKGTLCQFGYGATDANTTDNSNRYDLALNRINYDSTGNYPACMCWPASTAADGKIRVGFADTAIHTGASAAALLGRSNLYAVEQADWVEYIFYSPIYPAAAVTTQTRVAYLFARRANNTLIQIGTAPQRSAKVWVQLAMALSNLGEGISDYRLYNGDIYNLEGIWQYAPNAGDQAADACWPIKRSLFRPTRDAQTLLTELTCADATLAIVAIPDWITLTQAGASISLDITANTTGAERQGIIDVALFNGITYSIIIYQQA